MDLVTFAVQLLNAVQYGLRAVPGRERADAGVRDPGRHQSRARCVLYARRLSGVLVTLHDRQFLVALVGGVADCVRRRHSVESVLIRCSTAAIIWQQVLLSFGLILVFDEAAHHCLATTCTGVAVPACCRGSIRLTDKLSYPVYRLAVCVVCLAVVAAMFFVIERPSIGMMCARAPRTATWRAPRHRRPTASIAASSPPASRSRRSAGIDRRADLDGLSRHGRPDADPVLRGGRARRHRLGRGRAVGALLIGLADTFGKVLPRAPPSIAVYAVMAAVLLWRPNGILGARDPVDESVSSRAVP